MPLDAVPLYDAPDAAAEVAGHGDRHGQGLAVAGHRVLVQEALHDLVDGVVGRPHGLDGLEAVEELGGERREVAVAAVGRGRLLALVERVHHGGHLGGQRAVVRARPRLGRRAQVVPCSTAQEQCIKACQLARIAAERRGPKFLWPYVYLIIVAKKNSKYMKVTPRRRSDLGHIAHPREWRSPEPIVRTRLHLAHSPSIMTRTGWNQPSTASLGGPKQRSTQLVNTLHSSVFTSRE